MASEGKDRRWLWTNRNLTHKANLRFQPQFFCQLKHLQREGSGPPCQGINRLGKTKPQQARTNIKIISETTATLAFKVKHALGLNSLSLKITRPNMGSWIPYGGRVQHVLRNKAWCSPNCQGSFEAPWKLLMTLKGSPGSLLAYSLPLPTYPSAHFSWSPRAT